MSAVNAPAEVWVRGFWKGKCHKPSHGASNHRGPYGDDPCVYEYTLALDSEGALVLADRPGEIVSSEAMNQMRLETARLLEAAPQLAAFAQRAVEVLNIRPSPKDLFDLYIEARGVVDKALNG